MLEGTLFDQLQVLVQASKVYSEFLLCHYNKIDRNNYPLYISMFLFESWSLHLQFVQRSKGNVNIWFT